MASSVFIFPGNYTVGSITVTGVVLASDGTAAAPSYSFANQTTKGLFNTFASSIGISLDSVERIRFDGTGSDYSLTLAAASPLSWNSGVFAGISTKDLFLFRDAANTLAQRNGTNAQVFHLYNTYTDGSNFERGFLSWSGNTLSIGSASVGTGVNRNLEIYTPSAGAAWRFVPTGHMVAVTDNTYDIGAAGATRPRTGYFGTSVVSPSITTTNLLISATAPTIASGFGTSPSIVASNGTAGFTVNVGTGGTANSGVITMPAATTGWIAHVENLTGTLGNYANQRTVQIASTATSITLENQTISTGAALAWTASDVLVVTATGY